MEGRPSLASEGGSEGKWVGLRREQSQPFELPKQHPLRPQGTAPRMSLPEAREGGGRRLLNTSHFYTSYVTKLNCS